MLDLGQNLFFWFKQRSEVYAHPNALFWKLSRGHPPEKLAELDNPRFDEFASEVICAEGMDGVWVQ